MSNSLTGKPQLSRFVNRRLILDKIRRDGQISRAELAKQTSIRPPTVSAIIKQLLVEGLVEEVGSGLTSGGRAPRMIALSRNQPQALGFELSETGIRAGVCDLGGRLCARHQVSDTPVPPAQAVDKLYAIGARLLREVGIDWQELQGVGVAIPGHVNVAAGVVRWSGPFNWRDIPIKKLCEERWGVKTDVMNDSLAGSMAAHRFDTAPSVENLVYLHVRFLDKTHDAIGVGTGIIINGQPYHGEFGAAGALTTPVSHPLTPIKNAGSRSLETVAAFTQAVQRRDPQALDAMERVGTDLSSLVQHVVNLLEPGVLMIGSDLPVLRDFLLEQWQGVLEKQSLAYESAKTRLIASTLGEYAVVQGAIVPTLQRVFRIPQWP